MSEESLVVKLKGDTADLDKKIDSSTKGLNELDDATKKSDKSLASMGKVAGVAGGAVLGVAKAAIAVGAALTTMITLTAKGEQELQALSRQAKTTTGEFEALAFATKQYGINAEQVADISKDISDKLGEFASTGTGAFQDFADVTGKTTEEAQALAAEWQNLSSQQVIQEIANQLEDAGASANETTFVFESLGNDLSKLTPLFANNGKELTELTKRYNDVNAALSITQQEAEGLTEAATSFDLLTETLGNATKVISAQLAPALNEFFNGVIDVVPGATQVIVDFINTFRDAENIENIDSLNRLIDEQTASIDELTKKKNDYVGVAGYNRDANADEIITKARLNGEILTETQRLDELIAKRDEALEQQKTIADAAEGSGGTIGGSIGSTSGSTDGGNSDLDELIDGLKTEEQIRGEQYAKDLETAAGHAELLKEIERQYLEDVRMMREEAAAKDQARLDEQTSYYADILKQQGKIDAENVSAIEKGSKDKSKSEEAYLDAAITTGNALFEDQKAIKAGLVVVDTAAGISKAFAELPYPAALAASASIAATGVAQLAAITSASKGGGSTSSAVPAESLPDEVPELEAQNSDLNGSNQTVTIRFDESTELGVAFNNAIERSRQDGLI
ncbi:coil containing protein [Vibrio phage 1.144.O._10N.286.45.B3]|nr:coil containing protein [Vibrio phage 1.144.O._10N.286.45.B3]